MRRTSGAATGRLVKFGDGVVAVSRWPRTARWTTRSIGHAAATMHLCHVLCPRYVTRHRCLLMLMLLVLIMLVLHRAHLRVHVRRLLWIQCPLTM